jgi:methionine biosynthesis protein MetW
MKFDNLKFEHKIIIDMVSPGSTVLELGCGTGDLLSLLAETRHVHGQGIEIDEQAIYKCVSKGLSVLHGDIESGLSEYADSSFDYVILEQTFQELRNPDLAIIDALRVGKRVIVSFPNFVHWHARYQLFFKGRVPVTSSLPKEWYNTPNLHFLSINDFVDYCKNRSFRIENQVCITKTEAVRLFPNLFAEIGIFVISKNKARN